jgi:hypothetical protein
MYGQDWKTDRMGRVGTSSEMGGENKMGVQAFGLLYSFVLVSQSQS